MTVFSIKPEPGQREADVVIVNHHLFMADLSLKDDTMAELLPDADLIILDEAHKLPDIGIDYFQDFFSLWGFGTSATRTHHR